MHMNVVSHRIFGFNQRSFTLLKLNVLQMLLYVVFKNNIVIKERKFLLLAGAWFVFPHLY